jgi:AcrR family transcriptional regulator
MCIVESHAVGPRATEKLDTALSGFEQLMGYVFENLPGRGRMPPEMIAALIGGMRKMIHSRLHRHCERELTYVLPQVLDLWLSYTAPPKPLRYRAGKPAGVGERVEGRTGNDTVARIERAALATIAASGYADASLADIAAEAAVSLSTFYAHFDGKESALDSALKSQRLALTASATTAFEQSPTWPDGVRAGIETGFAFFESEPDFARVASCDIYGAGPMALEQLDQSIESLRSLLDGGFELAGHVQALAREAIPSAIYAMLCNRIQTDGTERLRELAPLGTYLLLAPFVGPEEAAASANSVPRVPRPSSASRGAAETSSVSI